MSKNKYASLRVASSVGNGQGQSFSPIIIGVYRKGDKVDYITCKNVCVYSPKSGSHYLLITHNAGIRTLGKLDYIRSEMRLPVLQLTGDKKFGSNITDRDYVSFKG